MAGIYIHIPFCLQACHYCDFHFSTSLNLKSDFLRALHREIELRKTYLGTASKIQSIYFGGGTPSLLNDTEINHIFEQLNQFYTIDSNAEITLEANPEDLSKEKLNKLRQTPINRFSIGIQSFFDEDLKFMNRAHHAQRAEYSVKAAQDAGFDNITIDLIYGTPTLSNENWKINLQKAFELKIKHLSAYCLTVEEKTALAHFIKSGKYKKLDEDKCAEQFELLTAAAKENKFTQYEISNFCSEENYSRHNSNYWKGEKYIGLGPSAHSFDGESRQWNSANNAGYIKSIEKGEIPAEIEKLDATMRYNEYILTGLRTIWGIDLTKIETNFGSDYAVHCRQEALKHVAQKTIFTKEEHYYLTESGKLFADKIAEDLFY